MNRLGLLGAIALWLLAPFVLADSYLPPPTNVGLVATLAALKAVPSPVAGQIAYRQGYTSAGDGGAATYVYSASACSLNAGAGDNGAQVKPTVGSGCWNIAPDPSGIDVRVWGVVFDGGTTDNQTAFAAALADSPSCVLVPASTSGLYYSGSQTVTNCLRGTTFNPTASTGSYTNTSRILCNNQAAQSCLVNASGAAEIQNITLLGTASGNAATAPVSGAIGFQWTTGYNLQIRNVQSANFDTCSYFGPTNGAGTGPISTHVYGSFFSRCKTNYVVDDGTPELYFIGGRWGENGGGDYNSADHVLYATKTVTGGSGSGPNTIVLDSLQINPSASVGCTIAWGNFVDSTGGYAANKIVNSHIEVASGAGYTGGAARGMFCVDSSVATMPGLQVSNSDFNEDGTKSMPFFNINSAVPWKGEWKFANSYLCSAAFTLTISGVTGAHQPTFTGDYICSGATFVAGDTTARLVLADNSLGTYAISGQWASLGLSNNSGTPTNTATGTIYEANEGNSPTRVTIPAIACDGSTDDASAINAALSGAANGAVLTFPAGKTCVFKSTLSLPHGKTNVTIDLNGSELLYSGTDSTVDLIDLGDTNSAGVFNIWLRNGRIWSSIFMTAGSAIHESYCGQCRVTNVLTTKYSTTTNTLWNGVQIDWPNLDLFDLDQIQAQNDCFLAQGGGPATASYDIYWTHGRMGSCTHGAHTGGGLDNFNIDSTLITSAGYGFFDDEVSTLGTCAGACWNQRINIGQTVSIDYGYYFPTQTITIAAAGSGGTNSASCFVQTSGGTGTAAVIDITISGGALTAVNHVHPQGGFSTKPTNPVSLATYAGTGSCAGIPTGATVNLNWTGGENAYINDPGCTHAGGTTPNASIVFGARSTYGQAAGVHVAALSSSPVAAGNQCPLILKGGAISAAGTDGLLVDDANAIVSMDSGTNIYGNGGYGVNASVSWAGLLSAGQVHDNTSGTLGSNVFPPTFATLNGSSNTQSGTTYTFVNTDCGKTVIFTSATAVTATIPAAIVPATGACTIAVLQGGAGAVSVNGSAVTPATLVSAHSYTKTNGVGSVIDLTLITVSAAAKAYLTGDGA